MLFNNVLIKIEEEESNQMYGSILVPDMGKEKSKIGLVIAIGPGFYTMNGTLIKPTVNVDDKVVLPKFGSSIINLYGEEYEIIKENDLLMIL